MAQFKNTHFITITKMTNLTSNIKSIQLPITCDTLLLTVSPHFNVIHTHVQKGELLYDFINTYHKTHKIVVVGDSPWEEIGKVEQIQKVRKGERELPLFCSSSIESREREVPKQDEYDDSCPKLIQSMISSVEEKSIVINLKNALEKMDRQIDILEGEIKEMRKKKCGKRESKNAKIKEKMLEELREKRKKTWLEFGKRSKVDRQKQGWNDGQIQNSGPKQREKDEQRQRQPLKNDISEKEIWQEQDEDLQLLQQLRQSQKYLENQKDSKLDKQNTGTIV